MDWAQHVMDTCVKVLYPKVIILAASFILYNCINFSYAYRISLNKWPGVYFLQDPVDPGI